MFDGSQLAEQEKALHDAEVELSEITKHLPGATKVKTFSKRMESALLAKYAAPFLRDGKPPGVANTLAMTDEKYLKELDELQAVFEIAEKVIKDHAAALTRWETARSLLSSAKAQIQPSFHQQRSIT